MAERAPRKDWRALPEAELRQQVTQSRQELSGLRLKARQGALEQPHRIRQIRRDIARMLTALAEQKTLTPSGHRP